MGKGSGPNGRWTEDDEFWHRQVLSNPDHKFRAELLKHKDCPVWLLEGTLKQDTFEICLLAAALNPKTPEDSISFAFDRCTFLTTEEFRKQRRQNILEYIPPAESKIIASQIANDRDQFVQRHILEQEKNNKFQNKFQKQIDWAPTEKYKIAMVVCPSWGVSFPPYGTAKLTALMRQQGYSIKVYDLNVDAFHELKVKHDVNYWENNLYWIWSNEDYFYKQILPDIKHLFDQFIEDIIANDVKVVGFSLYNTNQIPSLYLAKRLREALPGITLLAGGPGATITGMHWFRDQGNVFNYVFKGEAEETLMTLLNDLPIDLPFNKEVNSVGSRLSLEEYPYPDYTDYDLSLYSINGVSIETSRGCVAKCGFCAETHFWKYRDKDAERIADEFQHQIEKYGTRRFWIVDSLINGNLKIFSRWMDLVIERKLDLRWNCYSRCDGRMDAEFFKKIKKSGCTLLSFGIESGSQKVLHDMHKKVEVWEVLQNMEDCHAAGIYIHTSWLQGYATETPLDHMHTRQLAYNCRKWIDSASIGQGAGIAPNSDTDTNFQAYKIQWKHKNPDGSIFKGHAADKFLGDWYTEGYRCTILTRFIRVKLMNVWCHLLKTRYDDCLTDWGRFYPDIDKFYTLEAEQLRRPKLLENNDYIDVKQGVGDDISGLLVQDYLSFIYSLNEIFEGIEFTFHCEPEMDKTNFGEFLTRRYWCDLKATVDKQGNYTLKIKHSLKHEPWDKANALQGHVDYELEKSTGDKSFQESFELSGNFADWISPVRQTEDTIHMQYRKKVFTIQADGGFNEV